MFFITVLLLSILGNFLIKNYFSKTQLTPIFFFKPTSNANCSELEEMDCRRRQDCLPLGNAITSIYAEGETETFSFIECVERVSQFTNCEEVVKMTQMRGGSKYEKECRCCCGEGPYCRPEKPYPEK